MNNMVTLEQQTWQMGAKAAEKFFGGVQEKVIFAAVCDFWWRMKDEYVLPFSFCNHLEEMAQKEISNLLVTCYGAIALFDSSYVERIWVQKYNVKEQRLESLFYYDCFNHQFAAFEEV